MIISPSRLLEPTGDGAVAGGESMMSTAYIVPLANLSIFFSSFAALAPVLDKAGSRRICASKRRRADRRRRSCRCKTSD